MADYVKISDIIEYDNTISGNELIEIEHEGVSYKLPLNKVFNVFDPYIDVIASLYDEVEILKAEIAALKGA